MDDRILALCELSGDLLYHKIPPEKRAYYVDEALKAGREAAKEYTGADMKALYRENDIAIRYKDGVSKQMGVTFRGQTAFGRDGCAVELVRESIKALADNSAPPGGGEGLDYETAEQVHLAHEFFHYLEYKGNSFVSGRLDAVVGMKLLGFERKARINKCSEVAAHAFAKAVTGIPLLPNYYDYVYLVNTGKMSGEHFEALLAEKTKLLEEAG